MLHWEERYQFHGSRGSPLFILYVRLSTGLNKLAQQPLQPRLWRHAPLLALTESWGSGLRSRLRLAERLLPSRPEATCSGRPCLQSPALVTGPVHACQPDLLDMREPWPWTRPTPHAPHPPWPKCTGLNSMRLREGLWLCVLTGLSAPPAAAPGWSQEVGLDASFLWAFCIKPATKSHAAHLPDGPQPHGHHPGWASSPPLHTAPGFSPRVTLPRCLATPAGAPDAPVALRLRPCSGALCVSLSALPLSRAWHFSVLSGPSACLLSPRMSCPCRQHLFTL